MTRYVAFFYNPSNYLFDNTHFTDRKHQETYLSEFHNFTYWICLKKIKFKNITTAASKINMRVWFFVWGSLNGILFFLIFKDSISTWVLFHKLSGFLRSQRSASGAVRSSSRQNNLFQIPITFWFMLISTSNVEYYYYYAYFIVSLRWNSYNM